MRTRLLQGMLLIACLAVLPSCDPDQEGGAADPYELSKRTRVTAIEMGAGAENVMFSSTGRLYVSVDGGLYEVVRAVDGTLRKILRSPGANCQFGGLAEHDGVLFANCTDKLTASWLYAAYETEDPVFERIADITGATIANGLAVDESGRLYVAAQMQGVLLRLKVNYEGPVSVDSVETFQALPLGSTPNGLKIRDGALYWSGLSNLTVEELGSPGAGTQLFTSLTVVDDFYVDAKGILLADFLGGAVYSLDSSGRQVGKTSAGLLTNPAMVLPALGRLGFSQDDLLVVEQTGGNRVSILHK